ncbi:protein kinase domain-containing protein [Candidatus Nanohalobium constans]|uniref:Serine/threonine protein kinase n=1 Tax=Candidatus Nanohalobium constans TaxID=2565781 RepID=A0A5Q0UGX4_9ARCH|nr:protein kinase [Candidatus Nanohalobium constans]QGA80621.1 serine/threonine protein kinase [Candidatus Nanohalobium constans]
MDLEYTWLAGNPEHADTDYFELGDYRFNQSQRLFPQNEMLDEHVEQKGRYAEIYGLEDKVVKLLNPSKFENQCLPQNSEQNREAYRVLEDIDCPNVLTPTEVISGDILSDGQEVVAEDQFATVIERREDTSTLYDHDTSGITWQEAEQIISDVASGLSDLHSHGVVHHDIRPANIFYDQQNTILFDFDHSTTPYTTEPQAPGDYTLEKPPEIKQGGQIDQRYDIFQLGQLWTALTHQIPRTAPLGETIHKLDPETEINEGINPEVPQQHNQLMKQALSFKPEQRPQNAENLLNQIKTRPSPTI